MKIKKVILSLVYISLLTISLSLNAAQAACGNQVTEPGEACDGNLLAGLNGFSCATVAAGFNSGALRCKSDCSGYDVTGCEMSTPVVSAVSCDFNEVQSKVDSAPQYSIVKIPNGSCRWDGKILKILDKNIVLAGAGIDKTTISGTGSLTPDGTMSALIFIGPVILGSSNLPPKSIPPFRITGITFKKESVTSIYMTGAAVNWRIDNNKFVANDSNPNLWLDGSIQGLFDHNQVYVGGGVEIEGSREHSWRQPLSFGTGQAVFIESNYFDSRYENIQPRLAMNVDGERGMRLVYRYNTIKGFPISTHEQRGLRGPFSLEIYDNTWIRRVGDFLAQPISIRGGTAVIHNNKMIDEVNNSGNNFISIYDNNLCYWKHDGTTYPLCNGSQSKDGNRIEDSGTTSTANQPTDLSKNWPTNHWVGCTVRNVDAQNSLGFISSNTANSLVSVAPSAQGVLQGGSRNNWIASDRYTISCGYPCLDQIGRSTDASSTQVHPQTHQPIYAWNNKTDKGQDINIRIGDQCPLAKFQLRENVDFYNSEKSGYIKYVQTHPLAQFDVLGSTPSPPLGVKIN
jgi:hypothetical protein